MASNRNPRLAQQGEMMYVPPSPELSDDDDGSRACSGTTGTAKNAMESTPFEKV